jgi:predicted SnoaL-like aldol condensation-catalyzing enzyme
MNWKRFTSSIAIPFMALACADRSGSIKLQTTIDSLSNQLKILDTNQTRLEDNKRLVIDFYQEVFGDKNIDAVEKYIGEPYIQHNPALQDGKVALKQALVQWFRDAPKDTIDIQHVGADDNLVYIHTRSKMGPRGASIIDIFRIENGMIVEHWDVIQELPEKSANAHPMF